MIPTLIGPLLDWQLGRGPFDVQLFSVAFYLTLYYSTAGYYKAEKQRAWIITTAAALAMSLAAIPFLSDYALTGGSLLAVKPRPSFSVLMSKFFQGYLISDLLAGSLHYSSQVNLATGWGHHIVYVFIVEAAVRSSLAHIFCLCCIMELPTFILGLSKLWKGSRLNVSFATTFFMTRILLHLIVVTSSYKHSAKLTFLPAGILTAVFPLHAMWFTNCIRGFLRRQTRSTEERTKQPAQSTVVKLDIYQAPAQKDSRVQDPSASPTLSTPAIVKRISPLYTRAIVRAEYLRHRAASARETIYTSVGFGKDGVDPYRWKRRSMAYQGVESADSTPRVGAAF